MTGCCGWNEATSPVPSCTPCTTGRPGPQRKVLIATTASGCLSACRQLGRSSRGNSGKKPTRRSSSRRTPGTWELSRVLARLAQAGDPVPTGVLDPVVEVRPSAAKGDDCSEIRVSGRAPGTLLDHQTLTKRWPRISTDYLAEEWGASPLFALGDPRRSRRIEIIQDLRKWALLMPLIGWSTCYAKASTCRRFPLVAIPRCGKERIPAGRALLDF